MAVQSRRELGDQIAELSQSIGVDVPIDEAVRQALPAGTTVLNAHRHGESAWAFTAKILATDKDGQPTPFFLKMTPGELGRRQMPSEHDGMVELHKAAPSLVPEPIACGKCKDVTPTTHFLVLTFKQFVTGLPDPFKLGEQVAAMHKNGESSRGLFGFPVQTFDGARTHNVNWDASWTSFFSKLLAEAYRQSCETSGVWPELDQLYQRVQSHLIPRLIGALESEGRTVKPTIIHGNMWEGNIGTDSDGNPWIYDCSAYYGHNEMELGIWRAERHKLHAKVYAREYRRHYDPSEPEEEADDRVRLYSAKTNFMHSACYAGSPARECCFNDFTYLLKKYVDEDEEEEESDEDDEEIAQASVDFKKGDIAPSSVHVEDQALPVSVQVS